MINEYNNKYSKPCTPETPYYLYLYLDPTKPGDYTYSKYLKFDYEPFFCGVEADKRIDGIDYTDGSKEATDLTKRLKTISFYTNRGPIIHIRRTGLTLKNAYMCRVYLYNKIGLVSKGTGPLMNVAKYITEQQRKNMSEGLRKHNLNNPIKNKNASKMIKMAKTYTYRVKLWELTSPDGDVYRFEGGKQVIEFTKKMGLSYCLLFKHEGSVITKFDCGRKSTKINIGWKICNIGEKSITKKRN